MTPKTLATTVILFDNLTHEISEILISINFEQRSMIWYPRSCLVGFKDSQGKNWTITLPAPFASNIFDVLAFVSFGAESTTLVTVAATVPFAYN